MNGHGNCWHFHARDDAGRITHPSDEPLVAHAVTDFEQIRAASVNRHTLGLMLTNRVAGHAPKAACRDQLVACDQRGCRFECSDGWHPIDLAACCHLWCPRRLWRIDGRNDRRRSWIWN